MTIAKRQYLPMCCKRRRKHSQSGKNFSNIKSFFHLFRCWTKYNRVTTACEIDNVDFGLSVVIKPRKVGEEGVC